MRKPRGRHRSEGPTSQPSPNTQRRVVGPQSDAIDIYTASKRGLINHQTGEITLPQYGVSMLIDDAIIQGMYI